MTKLACAVDARGGEQVVRNGDHELAHEKHAVDRGHVGDQDAQVRVHQTERLQEQEERQHRHLSGDGQTRR